MKKLVGEIEQLLGKGQRLAVVTLFSQKGSTPRTAGAKMLVRSDGSIAGTIGGGLVEAQVIEAAVEAIASGRARVQHYDLTGELRDSADLICGGTMEMLVDVVDSAQQQVFAALAAAVRQGSRCALITTWQTEQQAVVDRCHSLVFASDSAPIGAAAPLPRSELSSLHRQRAVWFGERENRSILFEPFYPRGTVYLFGAGHVSLSVADLCQQVGFRVEVFDDREAFANRQRFASAEGVTVLEAFEATLPDLEIDRDSYLVIVTRGHAHDRTVLEQALRSDAGYIGMIGSRRKRDAIYDAMRAEGFGDADFERVYCPVGLPIKAETPEEIAVSIVAELIAHRAELAG